MGRATANAKLREANEHLKVVANAIRNTLSELNAFGPSRGAIDRGEVPTLRSNMAAVEVELNKVRKALDDAYKEARNKKTP